MTSGTSKIVRIDGVEVLALPGVANSQLVDYLEKLLEQAKGGGICGVIVASAFPSKEGYLRPAAHTGAGFTDSYSMIGALEEAKYDMLVRLSK